MKKDNEMGGNIPGGSFLGGNFPGGIFIEPYKNIKKVKRNN